MSRAWTFLILLCLTASATGAAGWTEELRPISQHEKEVDDAILQDLEIVKEMEMLQMLEMLREMEILKEVGTLPPPQSEQEEEAR